MDNKYLEEELQENILNEPSPTYKAVYVRPTPDYVLEDFIIGMEQYKRGECTDAFEFLEELKQRYL